MGRARRPVGGPLACLALALVALTGHGRPLQGPRHERIDRGLAEVLVQRNGVLVARGSAVAVAARQEAGQPVCYLLTAGHVLSLGGSSPDVVVALASDREAPRLVLSEPVLQVDEDDGDVAVLRAAGVECHRVPLASATEPTIDVWLAGFPSQGTARIWPGHVRDIGGGARWTVDAPVSEGTSGGGVFDDRTGVLVGLIQGYWTVRLLTAGGQVAGEAAMGTAAVIPLGRVRTVLRDRGMDDLLD